MNGVGSNTVTETLLRVHGLRKSFGPVPALRGAAFAIRSGELLGLIGPNGAGKTTLLECLAGVQAFDAGEIVLPAGGAARVRLTALLFYMPDGIAPWPDQPVGWALDYALGFFGGQRALLPEVIRELSLRPLLGTRISALSKGQRKRALIGLALLMPQRVLLIDEPFEGLDLRQSREVAAVLRTHVSRGRTVVVSIHQIADAARVCDRFVLLNNGGVVAEGTLNQLTSLAASRLGGVPCGDFEEVFLALT